ncbi:MAG: BrnA antitoxin family protein [Candidatus Accumulibacter propinquus]|jgi:uncharacterized protein (DUF4415 family)|uniref:BrnA antitoxin family protein n=1 Tax=Candidatus Accumulibacter propinquus TaxID=2954380 RepID=UPI002FC2C6E3
MKRTSSIETPDTSDEAPKLTPADFERARPRIAGKEASRAEGQAAVRAGVGKWRINIMLDAPIVEHFKVLAGERGYQTIINDTLRRVIESGHLEADPIYGSSFVKNWHGAEGTCPSDLLADAGRRARAALVPSPRSRSRV